MKFTCRLRRRFWLSNSKVLSVLGLCKKSGNLALGFDACVESATLGKSCLILVAQDLSANTRQKLYSQLAQAAADLIVLTDLSMDEIGECVGKSCGVISVNNAGFAKKIRSLLNIDNIYVQEGTNI